MAIVAGSSPPVRLGYGDADDVSSDDRWAVSSVPPAKGSSETQAQLWLLPTGVGQARQLTHGEIIWSHATRFVPGRSSVLAVGKAPGKPVRTYLISSDGSAKSVTPEGVTGTAATPDGKWVLAEDQNGWALYPLMGGSPRPAKGFAAGYSVLRLSADGIAAFVSKCGPIEVPLVRVDLMTGAKTTLAEISLSGDPGVRNICLGGVSEDGKSYDYFYVTTRDRLNEVTGLH